MTEVKGLRREQTERTRQRILDGAAEVFVANGFAGARIEDIAAASGVAVPTVYKVFTNKRNLLAVLVQRAMSGDPDAPVEEQAWWTEQRDEPDPARQLLLIARNARRIYERAGPILEVVRAAAPLELELTELWVEISDARMRRSRRSAQAFAAKGASTTRFTREEVVLTLWSLTGPELFTAHAAAGRTAAQYEQWLGHVLTGALLS